MSWDDLWPDLVSVAGRRGGRGEEEGEKRERRRKGKKGGEERGERGSRGEGREGVGRREKKRRGERVADKICIFSRSSFL